MKSDVGGNGESYGFLYIQRAFEVEANSCCMDMKDAEQTYKPWRPLLA